MINIKINELVYEIPQSWSEINIERFQDYIRHHIGYNNTPTDDENWEFLNKLRLISSLTRVPVEILQQIDVKYIKQINEALKFINKPINKQVPIKINIDGYTLILRDLKSLKLGDVVNIEVLTDNQNPILIIDKLIGILYTNEDDYIKNMDFELKCKKIREQVNIEGIYNLHTFFLLSCKILDKHMQTFTTLKNLKKEKKWMKWITTKSKYLWHNIITHWRLILHIKKYWK